MGTTATSGLSNVGSTWVGGVVPTTTTPLVIAHPGTNTFSSTPYTTNSAYAIGTTSLPVSGGTGSIVAGECIQLEHQTGTDADGFPIWHTTYYRVTTGITGNGTIVIDAPGLEIAIPAGTRVLNCGHVVTLSADHTWGNDTAGGFVVNGTLRWPAMLRTLTVRANYVVNASGTEDRGEPDRPIPQGFDAVLLLNGSATPAQARYNATYNGNGRCRHHGATRARRAYLTANAAASATSIEVSAATGWQVGDSLVVVSTSRTSVRAEAFQTVTIAAGYTPGALTVPLSAGLTLARIAGGLVVNVSSNVRTEDAHAGFGFGQVRWNAVSSGRLLDKRITNSAWRSANQAFTEQFYPQGGPLSGWQQQYIAKGSSFSGAVSFAVFNLENLPTVLDSVGVQTIDATGTVRLLAATVSRSSFIGARSALDTNFVGPVFVSDCDFVGFRSFSDANAPRILGGRFENSRIANLQSSTAGNFFSPQMAGTVVSGLDLQWPGLTYDTRRVDGASAVSTRLVACNFGSNWASPTVNYGSFSGGLIESWFGIHSADSPRTEAYANEGYYRSAVDQRKNGTTSLRLTNQLAIGGQAQTMTRDIQIVLPPSSTRLALANVRRANAAGSALPVLTISGPGISTVTGVPSGSAADTWYPVSLSAVNPTASPVIATLRISVSGAVGTNSWVDGVPDYPYIQAVRWYGYTFDETNPFRTVDPTLTLTESAAAALTGIAIDHTAQTITVTAARTAAEVYCACMLDLVTSLDGSGAYRARHITSSDGASFVTTYTVVLSGAGVVNGAYTDATGTNVAITAPNLISGTRVQLFNVTDNTEVANLVIGAGGFSTAFRVTSPKTMRLRATYVSGTSAKMPIQALGVVTAGGLSFVDSQTDDEVYIANAIDGSAVTEFAPDYPNIQVDISDPDGETSLQRLYAWHCWNETTAAGVANFFGAIRADDSLNYTVDSGAVSILLDNVNAAPVVVGGGYLRRSDGQTVIAATSGSIQMDPGRAYSASGGAVAADVWGYALESGFSASRVLRTTAAAVAGKTTGGPGGFVARNLADDADQISGTADENGNRNSASYGA